MVRLLVVTALVAILAAVGSPATSPAHGQSTQPAPHGLAVTPVPGEVTRAFRPPPTAYAAGHRGVDLAAEPGEPVVAAMGGRVRFSGTVAGVGWVTVDHGGGLDTTYGPLQPRVVSAGDLVPLGGLLGFVAGDSTHLDWGSRLDGEYIDPLSLLVGWETYLTGVDSVPAVPPLAAAGDVAGAPPAGRWLRPADGPITSGFGPRRHPITGQHRLHAGLDIGAPAGAAVRAAGAGAVSFAGTVSGYGRTVIVDHGDGVTTLYAHLSRVAVRSGQDVTAGATVGSVGSTGLSTGPHLHFEVRVGGVAQDPRPWLNR